jgi:hypothetical protein
MERRDETLDDRCIPASECDIVEIVRWGATACPSAKNKGLFEVDDGLEKLVVFKCDGGIPVDVRGGGGWFEAGTWRSSVEVSIESMGEASGELPLDSEKSSLNTSGFDSLDSEGLCDRDGRDTDDSRDGNCDEAMMIEAMQ